MSLTSSEQIAIEKFATKLKLNFPILGHTRNFSDRILNITNDAVHTKIDLAVEAEQEEFCREAEKEVKEYGKG